MLAYVFWHWPLHPAGYEAALLAFHDALAGNPPPGFRGSRAMRIEGRPWLSVPHAYEDWYFVDDFAALGALHDAAISGPRRGPHDVVAALPAGGIAGLYGLVRGEARRPRRASFRSKPAGDPYAPYLASLPAHAQIWQRTLVLSPAPEFCLLSDGPLDRAMDLEILYP